MNNIYIMSDIHGQFQPIRDLYTYLNSFSDVTRHPDESDILIITGDIGANFFFNYRDEEFKKKLGKYKFTYFFIRGNHEERPSLCADKNPQDWETEIFFNEDVWVEKKYPYIKYAMDFPNYYIIDGHLTMIFPGAYSVDKYHRLKNKWSWFPQEQLNESEMKVGKEMVGHYGGCELVLTHTCPTIYEPTDLFLNVVDQSLVDKSMERYLGEIEYNLDYRLWIFGHYHQTRIYPTNGHNQIIMCYNDAAFDLKKYFKTNEPYDSFIQFHKGINKKIINDMR